MLSPVLLVELVAVGRFTLDAQFPYVHAALKARGVPVTWLRFGLAPDVQYARGEDGIGLDGADLRALVERISADGTRALVFSHPPAAPVLAALAAFPSLRHRVTPPDLGELLAWLGHAPRDGAPAEADPDFGFVAGNAAARAMAPTAFVRGGTECPYARSVLDNPAYAGVDLAGCRTTGCAFCTSGGGEPPGAREGDPVAAVLRQIDAFLATSPFPDARARPALRVSGHRVLRDVVRLAGALEARPGRPLDLLFDARTDQLVALEPDLDAAAAALGRAGHRLHVCLVGVESFSRAELERMNKGVAPWVHLAAIRVLRALEARHPRSFRFREHGGLSTILYTPWTTLDDLALNLEVARHFELEALLGKLLTSRLRLYPGLPMTALAARDRLLADRYEDPALDTARRNFYAPELPWRFLHPEVEAVNRITTRLQPDAGLRSDPLFQRVQRAFEGRRPLEAAAYVVARALAAPGAGVDDLLRAGGPRAHPPAPGPGAGGAAGGGAGGPDAPTRAAAGLVALQRAGVNRVNRLEALPAREAAAVRGWLEREGRAVVAARLAPADGAVDLFFGADAGEAAEAAELTRLLYSGPPSTEVVRARRRIGELFGYPACCAARFSTATCSRPTLNEWLIVQRRAEAPGPVSPLLDPFHPVNPFVPCSFGCAAALARARRAHDALRASLGGAVPPADGHPKLFLLDRPGHFATLVPRGPVGRRFDFDVRGVASDDPRLLALARGGTLEVDGGTVAVERSGRRVASLHLSAALFWAGGAFDPEFWLQAALQVLEPVEPPRLGGDAAAPSGPPAAGALAARVRAALAARGDGTLAGLHVRGIQMAAGRVLLTLGPAEGGGGTLELYVEPLAEARHCYRAAGDLAITYARRTPLSSAADRRAVAELASLLGAG